MKVHPAIHFIGKNAIRLVLVAIFFGIPAGVLYLREVGIGFGAREALSAALSNNAIEVTIGRLALDPFSGLLARDATIRDRTADGRLLASVSGILLSVNLSELMRGKIAVDRLALADASVSIPVGAGADAPRLDLMEVDAEIVLLGDRLRLSRLSGLVEGIRVDITGQFLNPDAFHHDPGNGTQGDPDLARKLLAGFEKLKFPGAEPVLHAEVEADLAEPDSLRVEAFSFESGEILGEGWALKSLEIEGGYESGVLRIQRLAATDKSGALEASAEWSHASGVAEGSVLSTLSPKPFLAAAAKTSEVLRALEFGRPPQLDMRFTIGTAKPSVQITGAVSAPSVSFRGVEFREVGCQFAWKDGAFFSRDMRVAVGKGLLTGELWIAPRDFRINVRSTIAPTALLALCDPKTREFVSKMEFADLPDVSLALRGPKLDFASLRGTGRIKLGRTAMRGSWLDRATSDFELGDRCVTYKNFVVATGSGRGTGSFAYDVGLQEARLNGIRSTLVPYDVLMWIDPKIADAVKPYRFRAAPSATVQGKVHLKDPSKNNLAITVESSAGLEYELLGRTLQFGKTSGQVNVVGSKVIADVRRAALMGGSMAVRAVVSTDPKDPTFEADTSYSRINFSQLTRLYFGYDDSKGVMSGHYKFRARTGQENLMRGSGNIRVEDGNVLAIPVLGPFSEILGTILPGAGYHTAHLATADFTVAKEVINTKNLVIEGKGFSMYGSGDIHFMTSRLDMNMRINARGIPGIVFYPMSKLFEYVSTGTVGEPAWRPKIIRQITPPIPKLLKKLTKP